MKGGDAMGLLVVIVEILLVFGYVVFLAMTSKNAKKKTQK